MRLCGHPEEFDALRDELMLPDNELCKLRRITDPMRVDSLRESIAWTIRQSARMKKKYSAAEIAEANAFIDEMGKSQLSDID
jgi:hypothetical protein